MLHVRPSSENFEYVQSRGSVWGAAVEVLMCIIAFSATFYCVSAVLDLFFRGFQFFFKLCHMCSADLYAWLSVSPFHGFTRTGPTFSVRRFAL